MGELIDCRGCGMGQLQTDALRGILSEARENHPGVASIIALSAVAFTSAACSKEPPPLPEPRVIHTSETVETGEYRLPPISPLDPEIPQKGDIFVVVRGNKQHLVTSSGEVSKTGFDEIEYDSQLGVVVGRNRPTYGEWRVYILNHSTGESMHKGGPSSIEKRGGIYIGKWPRDCCPIMTDPEPIKFEGSDIPGVMVVD